MLHRAAYPRMPSTSRSFTFLRFADQRFQAARAREEMISS